MSLPVKTGLPDNMSIGPGYTIRFTAVDPTTGAVVAGVTVSDASIFCTASSGVGGTDLSSGPFMFVPGPGA